jgi:hypothetical protein
METYKLVLILIIYTAVLLLVIFYVYPQLKKLFSHKVSISIRIGKEEMTGEAEKKEVVKAPKQEKFPSILGETKFVLSQPLPNTATDLESENHKEKDDTFAPETEKSADENVNYETGEGIEVTEENDENQDVDLNDEDEDLKAGSISDEEASGIDFNNLGKTAKTISAPDGSTPADEDLAGKVLSENKYTGLVKSMQDARPEYAKRITELMDRYDRKLSESQNAEVKTSRRKQKLYESDDFRNFNVDEIS